MRVIKYLIVIAIILLQYSCLTEPENGYTLFRIDVDKITHPDSVSVNDTLIIKFDGYIGPNGCHSFSHFQVNENVNEIDIVVWGKRPNDDLVCPTVIVALDGEEYKTLLKQKGVLKIIVHQIDHSLLIDSVFVR